ncbi:MAG: primosomal protein N' [Acidobacteria bacterium]|nr:primosomal protein N' [Acidobacteriota bacterium]MBI3662526.1 primosomal protein N' [Acidobacteriota bacterium]
MSGKYCEVALPLPLHSAFTYAVPPAIEDAVLPGSRVVVPFRNRALVGVVLERTDRKPEAAKIREVVEVLDALPALPPRLLELGRWLASYYLAPIGEVFRAMLPPSVEVQPERILTLTDFGRGYMHDLDSALNRTETEVADHALLQLLEVGGKPLREIQVRKLPGGPAAAERLQRRGCIEGREVARRRKTRTQKIVAWNPIATHEPSSAAEKKLREVLTATRGPLPLPLLLQQAGVSRSVVMRLQSQGKLTAWEEPLAVEEDLFEADFEPPANVLNPDQQRAADEIHGWLDAGAFTVGLLYGVTGSGKTEVYLRAVAAALERGRAALVLVPEIALTLWIGRLCRAMFGEGVAVLHSALPDAERAREWWRVRRGEAKVVVGTRSAVFAPLENPGLIIVDEEQESSYKQEETPRYNGRDTAVVRAKLEGAVALLGSATPSMESFHNARIGKYRLLHLESRVEGRPLAAVTVVDMREDFRRTKKTAPLGESLRAAVAARLAQGTQALILMNRRGYSWFVLCRSCGASVQCENCSIALTFHKRRDRLICHYCGYTRPVPKKCLKCESPHVYFVGEGAEQVEEYLRKEYADARIGRLDRDTVRTKREYQKILSAFASGKLDLLVGTQMVAKGHDFQRVTLVGVVSADLQLGLPDFRAAERTFQLLTQVAGRAGRGALPGEVLVQTYYPEHYAIQFAARQDYAAFFEKELHFRRLMHYPPFTALANVIVRDRKIENAIRWARAIESFLSPHAAHGLKVLGPAAAPLARLKRDFRFQFLLKAPKRALLTRALSACLDFCVEKEIPADAVLVDVDPVSLL